MMGTFSGFYSRKDVVDHIVDMYSGPDWTIIDKKATNFGRHLWMVLKAKQGNSFVILHRLSSYRNDWGYKPIDESMGPCYHDCPVSLLDQADQPTTEYATGWRNKVYEYAGSMCRVTMTEGA